MIFESYKNNPNHFDPRMCAAILGSTFVSDESVMVEIMRLIQDYLQVFSKYVSSRPTADTLKEIKKSCMKEVSLILQQGRCSIEVFNKIYQLEPCHNRALSIIMSLARFPEWFLYSESELRKINDEIEKHVDEINCINYTKPDGSPICPYRVEDYHNDRDLYATIRAQETNIVNFLKKDSNIDCPINAEEIVSVLEEIHHDFLCFDNVDSLEQGFFDSCRAIRKAGKTIAKKMAEFLTGNAKAEMFTCSESNSIMTDYTGIRETFKKLGWNSEKIPNVLSLLIHPEYKYTHPDGEEVQLGIAAQPGQVCANVNLAYFDTAAGLGPAMKIRYVFNAAAELQSLLGMIADVIQQADKEYDKLMEAYNDQLSGIMGVLSSVSDAYCIDATGYSDYLFRGIYCWIMTNLYGWEDWVVSFIMYVFAMPIKVGTKFFNVEFGAEQGVKLLVFIMNHANRLMGIITNRLFKKRSMQLIDMRTNAGDDTSTICFNGKFSKQSIELEISVFAFFNSPCNFNKSAWLQRDGYFDFCSKYFARVDGSMQSITGIPPKLYGKSMLSIKSYTEIFRVLRVTNIERNSIDYCWDLMFPCLEPYLREGLLLPNVLKRKYTLEEKVQLARNYSFLVGGLKDIGELDDSEIAAQACNLLERYLAEYRFKPEGVFMVAQHWPDLEGTELYKLLGMTERQSALDIMEAIETLRTVRDGVAVEDKVFNKALNQVNILEKNIITARGLHSNSGSTYHRIDPSRDIDNFVENKFLPTPLMDMLQKPEDQLDFAMFVAQMSNSNYTDLDNLRIWINGRSAYKRLKSKHRIWSEEHFGYVNYYVRDIDDLIVKLTSMDRHDRDGYRMGDRFKVAEDIVDPDVRAVDQCINGSPYRAKAILDALTGVFNNTIDIVLANSAIAAATRVEDQILTERKRQLLQDQLKSFVSAIRQG